ncbi:MAG: hypothetical protein H6741_16740 [Alphaproteobacteria bacterium]|nr:hypothetical protein [Alphaproteobacteria bacterium]MCB9794363.1 hypothetical protein [Alphaproteobacteria bacterium]
MSKVRIFCQNETGDLQWLVSHNNTAPEMYRSPNIGSSGGAAGWFLVEADGGYKLKANTGRYVLVDVDAESVGMTADADDATVFVFNKQDNKFLDIYNIQVQGQSLYLIGRSGGSLQPSVALGTTGTKNQAMWTLFLDRSPSEVAA